MCPCSSGQGPGCTRLSAIWTWCPIHPIQPVSTDLAFRAIWQILAQPGGRIAHVCPAILVIPTSGTYTDSDYEMSQGVRCLTQTSRSAS